MSIKIYAFFRTMCLKETVFVKKSLFINILILAQFLHSILYIKFYRLDVKES